MLEWSEEDSMSKPQPTYTKEFKQQAVNLFETSGKSKTQIARDLGISDSALGKWCREFGEQGEEAFPGKGHQSSWFAHFWTQFSHLWCSSGEDSSILKRGKNNCFTEKCPYSLKALKAFYVKAVVPL